MAKFDTKAFEAAFEPFMTYGKMAAETAEKAFDLQVESAKAYSELSKENFTEMFEITNFDEMTKYAEKQKDVAKKASDIFVSDTKAFSDLGAKFFDSAKSLVEDSYKTTVATATKAAKSAAKAA